MVTRSFRLVFSDQGSVVRFRLVVWFRFRVVVFMSFSMVRVVFVDFSWMVIRFGWIVRWFDNMNFMVRGCVVMLLWCMMRRGRMVLRFVMRRGVLLRHS